MIALAYFLLCSVTVNGFSFFSTQPKENKYQDRIDRILDLLETGSDLDIVKKDTAVNWAVVLEQCILQKKDLALGAFLNHPNFIDWSGNNSNAVLSPRAFAQSLKLLAIDGTIDYLKLDISFYDYAAQGKMISAFVLKHAQELSRVDKVDARDIIDLIFYWVVSAKSVDDVANIINSAGMLKSVSEESFEYLIGVSIMDDNLEVFKVFMENPQSFERVKKNSKSLWRSLFPSVLDYKMNLAGRSDKHRSQLASYILSSSAIMETMDSDLVTSIFYSSFGSVEVLDIISRNDQAMKKVNTAQFTKRIMKDLKRNVLNEAPLRLWLTRPELSSFLAPQTLGYIFVDSAKKNWIDLFEIMLDREDLLTKIDAALLNKGIEINMDEHLEVIAIRLTGSPLLLRKLTNISVGLLFSRYLTFQNENVINAFLQREDLMSLVPPEYLAKGIDGLIVEDNGQNTQVILRHFLTDKYISRISDEGWETIVRHTVRNNKKNALILLFQHDAIFRRLSTKFLKNVKRWVNQNEKTEIARIVNERIPDTLFSSLTKAWNRFSDRRIRPKISLKSPFFTKEDFKEQFEEMKEMVREITKDGHALTAADQEAITRKVLENHAPQLMKP